MFPEGGHFVIVSLAIGQARVFGMLQIVFYGTVRVPPVFLDMFETATQIDDLSMNVFVTFAHSLKESTYIQPFPFGCQIKPPLGPERSLYLMSPTFNWLA